MLILLHFCSVALTYSRRHTVADSFGSAWIGPSAVAPVARGAGSRAAPSVPCAPRAVFGPALPFRAHRRRDACGVRGHAGSDRDLSPEPTVAENYEMSLFVSSHV